MRFGSLTLAVAALLTVPGIAVAQSAMAHDSMMASPSTAATLLCRKASDKDTHGGMMAMHEVSATTADGDKLVCKSMSEMHSMMSATDAKAKAAASAAAAATIWQDFLTTQVQIPQGGGGR
jgi:hypothetical protein